MKKIIVLFVFLLSVNCYAQNNLTAKNIIYFDFGVILLPGAGAIGCGISYERMIDDNFSFRTGVNINILASGSGGDAFSSKSIGFPISINYMTKNKNKFEVGLGGGQNWGLDNKHFMFLPSVRLGYRYQPDENGMMYKAGLEFPSNFYISLAGIGYHFK